MKNGLNDRHLAVWMKESGYNTYYVGKLFNYHNTQNYNRPPMKGYTGSEFFLEPYTYQVCCGSLPIDTTRGGGANKSACSISTSARRATATSRTTREATLPTSSPG